MSEHTSATDERALIAEIALARCRYHEELGGQIIDEPCSACLWETEATIDRLGSSGHGIYRVADVEALVKYCEARMRNTRVYDASVFNRIAATDSDTQLRDAWEAITDDLLARCRREP